MLTLLSFLVVLGVLIFVHELGHFLAAKAAGIHVYRFSLGFGSPIPWLSFRWRGTEYAISWLPLGGYVKMASREEEATSSALEGGKVEADVPPERYFEAKPVWQRMVVILAGVTMNALFAWGTFVYLAAKNGEQIDPTTTVGLVVEEAIPPGAEQLRELEAGDTIVAVNDRPVNNWNEITELIATTPERRVEIALAGGESVTLAIHPDALAARLAVVQALQPYRRAVVDEVVAGSPAAEAGLEPGDTILAVGGRPTEQWYDLLDALAENPGEPVTMLLGRAGSRQSARVDPTVETVLGLDGEEQQTGRIGVALAANVITRPYSLSEALGAGWGATVGTVEQIVRSVRGMVSGRIPGSQLGGPILIGQLAGEAARLGLDRFLAFMALISVNLAILNLLPIPVLDGGQFVFLLAEAVIRRPLPLKLRERLTMLGLVLIVLLMVFAFSNDIMRLFGA